MTTNAPYSQINNGSAVATGHVIRNGSDPNFHDQFIFNDFANADGFVYHTDFNAMLGEVTRLDPTDPTRDQPGELTQSVLHRLNLALDHDNNTVTPAQVFSNIKSLLGTNRTDTRYGEGVFGEMYISSKQNGTIYLVTNSVPLAGDFDEDRDVDAADYVVWRKTVGQTGYHLAADGDGNGTVNALDLNVWRSHFGQKWSQAIGTTTDSASAVPEPTTALLLLIALAANKLLRPNVAGTLRVSSKNSNR